MQLKLKIRGYYCNAVFDLYAVVRQRIHAEKIHRFKKLHSHSGQYYFFSKITLALLN